MDAEPKAPTATSATLGVPCSALLGVSAADLADMDACYRELLKEAQRLFLTKSPLRQAIEDALVHITWPNADCAGAERILRAAIQTPNK